MTSDEQAFHNAIDAAPNDDAPRLVFADWLDERGRDSEAAYQRGFNKAIQFIGEFTDQWYERWDYDDEGEKIEGSGPKPYDAVAVMKEVEYWKACVEKHLPMALDGNEAWGNNTLCFSTNHAQDTLHDPEVRRKFWEAFTQLTGVVAPEDLRNQEYYRCGC